MCFCYEQKYVISQNALERISRHTDFRLSDVANIDTSKYYVCVLLLHHMDGVENKASCVSLKSTVELWIVHTECGVGGVYGTVHQCYVWC